ncbi:calcium homeostasis modulator protein 5-like [Colossoma macropomum]|uniref:calcium homeostasis modulator protein 5-like n=1 Tax=Colossoma macropomum TaxID=42526 RepID=UPI001865626E|nr:calcium homeostasis modulator protein 5-like [Colossoma macropomum]
MSVRIQEFIVIVWQTTKASLPLRMTCLTDVQHCPLKLTFLFFWLLLGIEKLMEMQLSCPCKPGVNEAFVAFMFIVPALLVFTVMLLLTRPCKHPCRRGSSRFAQALLPCLIPPTLWVILLLLNGQYVACGLTYWKGIYVLDEDKPPLLWCEPSSSRESVEKALYRRYIGWSQVSGLILVCSICIVTVVTVGQRDCRQAREGTTPEEEAPILHS